MQAKVFILSFISAAKHRFWRTGDRLVEIQNIYVLCARVEAPLPSHLCLAHSVYKKKEEWKRTFFVRCRTLLLRSQESVQGTNPDVEFALGQV